MNVTVTTEWCPCIAPFSYHEVVETPPWTPFATPVVPPVPLPGLIPCPSQLSGPAPPPKWIHQELPVPAAWPGGKGQHKFTSSVIHRGDKITLAGHDCGKLIPHMTKPPAPAFNLLITITIITSSRKSAMTASGVKMNGAEVAVSLPIFYQVCSNMPWPICPVITLMNSVEVGVSWGDFLLGIINVAVDLVVSRLQSQSGKMFEGQSNAGLKGFGRDAGLALAGSLVKGAASYLINGKGKAAVEFAAPAGLGSVKFEIELEKDPKTGKTKWSKTAEVARLDLLRGRETTVAWKQNSDGSTEVETKTNTVYGSQKTQTTKTGADGKETKTWSESPLFDPDTKGTGDPPAGHEANDRPV